MKRRFALFISILFSFFLFISRFSIHSVELGGIILHDNGTILQNDISLDLFLIEYKNTRHLDKAFGKITVICDGSEILTTNFNSFILGKYKTKRLSIDNYDHSINDYSISHLYYDSSFSKLAYSTAHADYIFAFGENINKNLEEIITWLSEEVDDFDNCIN